MVIPMKIDRLRAFLGKSIKINEQISIYSPIVNDIAEMGEDLYRLKYMLATFNKELLIKMINLNTGIEFNDELTDPYDLFTSNINLGNMVADALSFFVKDEVLFLFQHKVFYVDSVLFIDKLNYLQIANIIKTLTGTNSDDEKQLKFRNNKAKEMYMLLQKMKEKYEKDDGLELKDILSILCQAPGNGVDVFNVGKLTLYQVFEHFERLSIYESHTRMLRVWANGLLEKKDALKEWMVKTKL